MGAQLCGGDGAANESTVNIDGASIDVEFEAAAFELARTAVLGWVKQSAHAVGIYLGGFPVTRAHIRIVSTPERRGVSTGTSWGKGGARSRIIVGSRTTVEDLNRDWVLTHEMLHYAFPSVPEQHSWIEEWVSTYVEPIARAGVGLLRPEQVWADMVRDMPKGLPEPGDRGLDATHTWGRTYWGGALFCLMADVELRKSTSNRKGLRDALRAVNRAGGNITAEWPLERAIEIADCAMGASVLADLYRKLALTPFAVDLPALWGQLGIHSSENGVEFDDRAPLSAVRQSIA
jgi:hypothetical protein